MAQVNKFAIVFVLLLAINIVRDGSKLQVMASCSDSCSSNSDCTGFTLCRFCFQRTNPFDDTKYSACGFLP
ncbi:hypothetical protein RDI58_012580 [Solanum bulbocastanum]|uniref:Carboxypeptidase A inhibitor-like domain-containing protein n=1 Tax=Solanum bulbocastanum TaxID=147425 RepID=A0AAN8TPC1_SOLBU